ncbi:hypothetical protein [Salipiger bermudensis]|uniref:hypothetical protein n=1 Tax=Salipiger bermudensis TaxID=344736 RepID=UPI001A8DC518|nr:hypothetical protein [Salipiger bermudensis]MBN9676333.1 hypothetical protein [Salipiger bermudensis]
MTSSPPCCSGDAAHTRCEEGDTKSSIEQLRAEVKQLRVEVSDLRYGRPLSWKEFEDQTRVTAKSLLVPFGAAFAVIGLTAAILKLTGFA